MSGWHDFAVLAAGAIWGAATASILLWHFLIEPMGKALGFDRVGGEER